MKIQSQEEENPLLDLLPLFLAQDPLRSPNQHEETPESSSTRASSSSQAPGTPSSLSASSSSSETESWRYDPNLRPLPFGWDRAYTEDGTTYFMNHHKKITQWHHPVDSITADVDLGLPPGWEMRKTAGGRTFYLDHNAGATTWVDPRISPDRNSPLAPLRRKLSYLASHLRLHDAGEHEDLWICPDALFEYSVDALMSASNHTLTGEFGIWLLDESSTRMPFQDWIDILFSELFSPERGLFEIPEEHPSQVVINSSSSVQGDTLKLYSFAGRLHALAIVQHVSFNLSFLPSIYSALYEYGGASHTTSGYASDAKSLRKEAFMDAFIELVPPNILRVFTLSELHVVLAAGREWDAIEDAYAQLPEDSFKLEKGAIPSHTNEHLLDELMVKLTGFRIETSQYVVELT